MVDKKERNTVECERFADQTGFACAVAGHFPHLPPALGPPPVFKPSLPPSALRLSKFGRPPRGVAGRTDWLTRHASEPEDDPKVDSFGNVIES
jgi:hypothetical protein